MPINVKITADEEELQEGFDRAVKVTEDGAWRINSAMEQMADRTDKSAKVISQSIANSANQTNTSFNQMATTGTSGMEKLTSAIESGVKRSWDAVKGYAEELKNAFKGTADEQEKSSEKITQSSEKTTEGLNDTELAAGGMAIKFGAAAGVVTAAVGTIISAANKIAESAKNFTDSANAINDLSYTSGVAAQKIQDLQAISGSAGITAGLMMAAYSRLNDAVAQTTLSGQQAKAALDAMHISLQDGQGKAKSYEEILTEIADKFASYEDGSKKVALANGVFGTSEASLIALLDKGGASFKAYMAIAEQAGNKISDAELQKQRQVKDSELIIAEAVRETQEKIDQSAADIKESIMREASTWKEISSDMGQAFHAFGNLVSGEVDKIKIKLGMLPAAFKDMQAKLAPMMAGRGESESGLSVPELDLSNPKTQKAAAPQIFSMGDFDKTFNEIRNKEENILTWKAENTKKFWEDNYTWAANYYGKESVLAKQLWDKKADAERGAVEKDTGKEDDRFNDWREEWQRWRDIQKVGYKDAAKDELEYWQKAIEIIKTEGGEGSDEYYKVVHRMSEIQRQEYTTQEAQQREVGTILMEMQRKEADTKVAIEQENIKTLYDLGKISATQRLQMENALYQQEYQAAINANYAKLDVMNQTVVEQARIYKEIEKLQLDHTKKMANADNQMVQESKKSADEIARGMSSALTGMIFSTQTMAQKIQSLFQSMATRVIDTVIKKLVESWLVGETTKTAATEGAETMRLGIKQAAATEGLGAEFAANLKEVSASAYAAGAKAYAAVVGIPIIGPVLAPVAAATAFTAVLAFGSGIPSAAGGWDVPQDTLAMVHKDEKILSPATSKKIDNMTSGAGGGNTYNYIQAWDGKDVERVLIKHGAAVGKAVKSSHRLGHLRFERA
jgi:hypothetical protein